jgi:hypothetical protein
MSSTELEFSQLTTSFAPESSSHENQICKFRTRNSHWIGYRACAIAGPVRLRGKLLRQQRVGLNNWPQIGLNYHNSLEIS